MPPKPPLLPWRCPQCSSRTFSTTTSRRQLGPEHPKYIPIPQPPQQTAREKKFSKGYLPVPRDVFAGAEGRDKASDSWLQPHTQAPRRLIKAKAGSREEWKSNISAQRRQNLREGLQSLRARKTLEARRHDERAGRKQREREELLRRPEREDERLTAPSHGLNLKELLGKHPGGLADPGREERIARMRANLAAHTSTKEADRQDAVNQLYMHARTFIVNQSQLDAAVDEAFGTPENPVAFGPEFGRGGEESQSVWAYGRPESVQDMLNRANGVRGSRAMEGASGYSKVNADRIRRIAEVFTGGRMGGDEEVRR